MWACRKAAATAFSTANMRAQFPNIRLACSQLIEVLKGMGPNEVVDMDNALCRESLDVIGEALCAICKTVVIWWSVPDKALCWEHWPVWNHWDARSSQLRRVCAGLASDLTPAGPHGIATAPTPIYPVDAGDAGQTIEWAKSLS